jgi:hypothetical protein
MVCKKDYLTNEHFPVNIGLPEVTSPKNIEKALK